MSQRPGVWHSVQHTSMVTALIWANVIIFVLQIMVPDNLLGQALQGQGHGADVTTFLSLNAQGIRHFEIWRLGTYMFAHGGFMHIFMNMWGLYLFGRLLEDRIGSASFLNLYFISGLIGGGTWLFFNWDNPYGSVIGASGAVFGVMMAAAMLFPNQMIMLLIPPVPMKLKTFVAVYAGLEVFLEFTRLGGGSVAHLAHLGGMLGGFLYMRKAYPTLRLPWFGWRLKLHPRPPRVPPRIVPPTPADGPDTTSPQFRHEVDRILDKIGRDGLASLTPEERRTLERARERLRQR